MITEIPREIPPRIGVVIVHCVVQEIFQLLSNSAICNDETMDFPGGYPGAPLPERTNTHVYDEVTSGDMWYEAHKTMNVKPNKEVLIGIMGACDKAIIDKLGKLALEPFMFTLANIFRAFRNNMMAWRIAGYLINQTLAQYKGSANKLQDYHEALEGVITAFKILEAGQGIAWVFHYKGQSYPVILRFLLLCIIGDTVGHDKLCCRYESRSLQSACICRYCNVPTAQADNAEFKWKYWAEAEIQKLIDNDKEEELKQKSFKYVKHAFAKLGFGWGGGERKVHGALPAELLHLIQLGLMLRLILEFYCTRKLSAQGKKKQQKMPAGQSLPFVPKSKKKSFIGKLYLFNDSLAEGFEEQVKIVGKSLQQQSDRNLPRTHFPQGVLPDLQSIRKGKITAGKKCASEIQGMVLDNLFMLASQYGEFIGDEIGGGNVITGLY
jgi:Plavaka transposase